MDDIAPALLEKILNEFQEELGDQSITDMTYAGAADYAERVGDALAKAFRRNISSDVLPDGKMYWNIADRVIRPMLETDHQLISDVARQAQQALNEAAGLRLKAQAAEINQSRVDGILNKVCAADQYDDAAWVLDEPVKTFGRSVVDDTLKANVNFQGKSGLVPKIIRHARAGCCAWCSILDGTYEYPNIPKDVYRRHERCKCTVEYDPGSGKMQNVWTKTWKEDSEARDRRISRNQEYEQMYRPVKRGESKTFVQGQSQKIIARRVDGYDNEIYVSDDAVIKPRALHIINRNTNDAIKQWGISGKPTIVIVSEKELPTAHGKYDVIRNVVYYTPRINEPKIAEALGGPGYVEFHEMWHMKQGEIFKKRGWVITPENKGEYLKELRKECKKNIDKLGITEDNVDELGTYAERMFYIGKHDEVEADYKALRERKR